MAKTALLPPVTAIRMVWAMTGKFSDDEPSQAMARFIQDSLKRIEDDAQKTGVGAEEKGFVMSAIPTMKASLRSLDTAYKGRDLKPDPQKSPAELPLVAGIPIACHSGRRV